MLLCEIVIDLAEAERSQKWLLDNRDGDELLEHWDLSYPLRDQDCQDNEYKTLADIFEKWPVLKEADQYLLVYE